MLQVARKCQTFAETAKQPVSKGLVPEREPDQAGTRIKSIRNYLPCNRASADSRAYGRRIKAVKLVPQMRSSRVLNVGKAEHVSGRNQLAGCGFSRRRGCWVHSE